MTADPDWTPTVPPTTDGPAAGTDLVLAPRYGAVREILTGDRPSPWSDAAPPLVDQYRYVTHGEWCAPEALWLRRARAAFFWVVTLPVTALAHGAIWLARHPGRLIPAAALVLLIWLVV
jgi:hypothetical protein